MRNYRGVDFNSGYPLTELNVEDIEKIFLPEFLASIRDINFNGNLGDFGLAHDAPEIVQYFLNNSTAQIQIETNGSMRSPDWWAQFADPRIQILFALDGLADTHHLYRQDTDWHRIVANAQALISAGGRAVWKFIPFEHNRHQLDACRQLAKSMGFDRFEIRDHGRNRGPVFSRTGEFSHWLGQSQDWEPDAAAMIQDHVTWFDPKKKIDWIKDDAIIDCHHLRRQEIYVAADGSVYPCCYLGYFPKTMSHPGNSQIKSMLKNNNALEHGLAASLDWFDAVEESWQHKTVAQGRVYGCAQNCSV
jgi:sulfatase maturation enzyme AslB (radical SAM superfamily)